MNPNKYALEMNALELIEKVAKILGKSFEECAYSLPPQKAVELLVKEIERRDTV
jgi:hypothetical protein